MEKDKKPNKLVGAALFVPRVFFISFFKLPVSAIIFLLSVIKNSLHRTYTNIRTIQQSNQTGLPFYKAFHPSNIKKTIDKLKSWTPNPESIGSVSAAISSQKKLKITFLLLGLVWIVLGYLLSGDLGMIGAFALGSALIARGLVHAFLEGRLHLLKAKQS